ncbi:MAG: 4Fe-4S binding protein [Proteobacteria bacterium]|nr:4Fe-4S binding protein [Pseudomonadota bacterium]MBU1058160.1 4Fe-4S binding protein [Pseudomonadota bacterium]
MNIETAHLICYSPTRTTFTNLHHVAEGMELSTSHILDLTLPNGTSDEEITIKDGVALIGVPIYAGRVAPVAAKRLQTIKGRGTPAVIAVVYGNRHYENALIELKQLVEDSGFKVIAGATLIGEHSYSSDKKPIALGRPDEKDKHIGRQFGAKIMEKLKKVTDLAHLPPLELPGSLPEGPYLGPANITPEIIPERCILCGQCVECCPTGAIKANETISINASLCTFCCACLKTCPEDAVRITIPKVLEKVDYLYEHFQTRREPELFL